jgi:hypothetical protein
MLSGKATIRSIGPPLGDSCKFQNQIIDAMIFAHASERRWFDRYERPYAPVRSSSRRTHPQATGCPAGRGRHRLEAEFVKTRELLLDQHGRVLEGLNQIVRRREVREAKADGLFVPLAGRYRDDAVLHVWSLRTGRDQTDIGGLLQNAILSSSNSWRRSLA